MCLLLSDQSKVQIQGWKRLDMTDKQNVPEQKAFADFHLLFTTLNLHLTYVPGEKAAEGSPSKVTALELHHKNWCYALSCSRLCTMTYLTLADPRSNSKCSTRAKLGYNLQNWECWRIVPHKMCQDRKLFQAFSSPGQSIIFTPKAGDRSSPWQNKRTAIIFRSLLPKFR